jgi:hypothetical protein
VSSHIQHFQHLPVKMLSAEAKAEIAAAKA